MQSKHWLLIGSILVSLGAMGATADTWAEVLRPGFIFPAAGAIGTVVVALFTNKVGKS